MTIKNIFIFHTPFQKSTISRIFNERVSDKQTIIFYSKHVSVSEFECVKIPLSDFSFSFSKLQNLHFEYFKNVRLEIRNQKEYIKWVLDEYNTDELELLCVGTDKDVFIQLLFNHLESINRKTRIIAVDEGLGYYKTEPRIRFYLMKILYRLLTPILFGSRINYVFTLGQDSRISEVYLRFLNLNPKRVKGIEYKEIGAQSNSQLNGYSKNTKSILVYSFPSNDLGLSETKKIEAFDILLSRIPSDFNVQIKPHPRENLDFLNKLNQSDRIEILDKKEIGENLIYKDYRKIVNFYSSIVLDILESGYNANDIITIGFRIKPNVKIFIQTNYYHFNDIKSIKFED